MTTRIERPVFFESQILGAADLTGGIEYHRGQAARHNRYLHVWGIADGLEGDPKDPSDGGEYVEIWIKPGIAIDKSGREIILSEPRKLQPSEFINQQVKVADDEADYPVFLVGQDEPAPQQPFAVGACNTSQPTRKIEGLDIIFGRPIDALDLDNQPQPGVTEGPADRASRVLLGFVRWDKTIGEGNFKAWSDTSLSGIGRRYAGVKADIVSARGKSLVLIADSDKKSTIPAVGLGGKDEEVLFGVGFLTDQGSVNPLFSITPKGDVKAAGTISGAVKPDTVQIQSGQISDGVTVPLPPGITEEQVTKGQVTLHIQLTPSFPGGLPPTTSGDWTAIPIECGLDPITRRVLCRFRWFEFGGAALAPVDLPGVCTYVVIASVGSAPGA